MKILLTGTIEYYRMSLSAMTGTYWSTKFNGLWLNALPFHYYIFGGMI
jgi:hypothetical protein